MDRKRGKGMKEIISIVFTNEFFYSVLRVTTPILFAAMGAVVSNVAGVPNIALEGMMLIAAFCGMLFSYLLGGAGWGLAAAVISGIVMASILAFFTLYYKTNIILGGVAINSLASGGTIFFLYLFAHDKGTSVSLASKTLPNIDIPILKDIPVLGSIFSGHNILTYVSILSVIVVYFMLKRTALGYRIRAVGQKKEAAESVGISVIKVQATALIISGILAGLGGAFMSMGYVSWFSRDMVSGRGWIALAAEAMGQSTPFGTAATALLFGVADAFSNAAASLGWPSDLVKTIPYCATIIGLTIFSVRAFKRTKQQ